jgi:aminopeptidase N
LKIFFISTLLVVAIATALGGQQNTRKGAQYCAEKATREGFMPSLMSIEATEPHAFDALSYKLNLDISECFRPPFLHSFQASEVLTARADSTMNSITLDAMRSSLFIDAVSLAGRSFVQSASTVTITLDRNYDPGETFDVGISYRHLDVLDGAFYVGNGMVFTDCEPEGARRWFPCWDKPADKATWDLTATVAPGVRLGSNGTLVDSTVGGNGSWTYHWRSRDPIATFLMVITARSGYNLDILEWPRPSNPAEKVPFRFYWNTGENVENLRHIQDIVLPMASFFSSRFGEYPFEKNGFATLSNLFPWGGMENQTLVTLCSNCWIEGIVSHQFAHQWFGALITPATWADIWLSEGLSTYSDDLWIEHQRGTAAYDSAVGDDAVHYFSGNPGWPIVNPSWAVLTPPAKDLLNYSITYSKGACVMHMLRHILGDSLFFAGLKSFTTDPSYRFRNARTSDFVTTFSEVAGQDLSWFFDEWLSQPNHPVYQNSYWIQQVNPSQWTVVFAPRQVQTNSGFFKMPIDLKITFAAGADTVIRVTNNTPNDQFSFTFSRQPVALSFDPNNAILLKTGSTLLATSVDEPREQPGQFVLEQNYPNPFNPATRIKYTIGGAGGQGPGGRDISLIVYDVLGRKVATLVNEQKAPGNYEVTFDASGLSSGVYFYRLTASDPSTGSGQRFSELKKLCVLR